MNAEFDESKIVRDDGGRFATKPGGGGELREDSNQPTTSIPDHQREVVELAETYLSTLSDVEEGVVVFGDGEAVAMGSGLKRKIVVPREIIDRATKDGNTVLTHNHPSGSAFSYEDVMFAVGNNLKEIRAIGVTNKVAYSLRRPEGGWPPIKRVHRFWKNARVGFLMELKMAGQVREKTEVVDAVDNAINHRMCLSIAKEFGLNYTVTKP